MYRKEGARDVRLAGCMHVRALDVRVQSNGFHAQLNLGKILNGEVNALLVVSHQLR